MMWSRGSRVEASEKGGMGGGGGGGSAREV